MIGAVLAGGAGSRLGQSKATASLAGRPLIAYPLAALAGVCERVVVVCKPASDLPELDGIERWDEPLTPRHPLTGIVHALETASAPVLVCAVDMPFVTADACRSLVQASGNAPAVVATATGVLQPVFALYAPAALETLREAPADAALAATVELLDPTRVALPPAMVAGINTRDDLQAAEQRLSRAD